MKKIALLISSLVILMAIIFYTINYNKHEKVIALIDLFYPIDDGLSRDIFMTSIFNTIKWEFDVNNQWFLRDDKQIFIIRKTDDEIIFRINNKDRNIIYNKNYKYESGDIIYYFNTPVEYWENLIGREGYAVFRGNKLILCLVASLS